MADEDLGLMAHLLRRAGFGASREELEAYAAQGYDEVVEDLVDIERCPPVDEDILHRYIGGEGLQIRVGAWIYRMINSRRPLEEKMALFGHQVFATGYAKGEHALAMGDQIDLFRRVGMTNMREILLEVSMNPAMINWLDNSENRKGEPKTRTTGASCWNSSRWGSATTLRRTSRTAPAPSPAGPSRNRFPSTPTASIPPNSSSAQMTTMTARRPSSATPAT